MAAFHLLGLALIGAVTCTSAAQGHAQTPLDATCRATPLLSHPHCNVHDGPRGFQAYMPVEANGLWEVRMTADKGRGLFAVVDIPRGTRLLTEDPLVTVTPPPMVPGRGFELAAMLASVESAFNSLSSEQQGEYLSCHEVYLGDEGKDTEAGGRGGRLLRILRSNAYTMEDGRVGLYPKVALINHDCRPNVLNTDLKGGAREAGGDARQRVIVATRDIRAGEEIVTTYVPLLMDTAGRRARLQQYGFTCHCASCQSAGDDDERVLMKQILDGAAAAVQYSTRAKAREHAPGAVRLARYVRDNRFADYSAQTSRMAAELSYTAGDLKTAATWAAIHVDVAQLANMEGAESSELRQARKLAKTIQKKMAAGTLDKTKKTKKKAKM